MNPLELTARLVAAESPTGAEGPAVQVMEAELRSLGYAVERQPVSPGRDNLYAFRDAPELVFSTHLDCVPPYLPFREDATHLHGRGACDAKGIAAAMVAAAEELAAGGERRIGLLFVVGEEAGSDGARAAARLEPRGRFLVNGEPTENRLTVGQKGSLEVRLEARGRAAHSAYPEEGESAITALLETIRRLEALPPESDPVLGTATLNIGNIQGGVAPNVIAPEAMARLLFRTVGSSDGLRQAIPGLAAPGVRATFPAEIPAFRGAALPGWEADVVSFASDLPFHSAWGQRYQMGPGSIRVAHTDRERIAKDELLLGVARYVRLARALLEPPDPTPLDGTAGLP